jgi:hypothetical protein
VHELPIDGLKRPHEVITAVINRSPLIHKNTVRMGTPLELAFLLKIINFKQKTKQPSLCGKKGCFVPVIF